MIKNNNNVFESLKNIYIIYINNVLLLRWFFKILFFFNNFLMGQTVIKSILAQYKEGKSKITK